MDVPHLNIEELYETKQKIDINRLKLYNNLLSRIHNKIKITSRQRDQLNFCSYCMPEILVGFPNYNMAECLTYIIDKLEFDGFLCKYIHPNLLMISWNHWIPQYVRDEIKRKTGKLIDCYGNEEVKNKITFNKEPIKKTISKSNNIYDDSLLDSMNNLFKKP
tara:strand:- start:283 stop:768 length:486 start_codon:yes stop_codon:yes gene_type:complete